MKSIELQHVTLDFPIKSGARYLKETITGRFRKENGKTRFGALDSVDLSINKGEIVDILSKNDKLLGCGIIAYDSDEIEIISGKKSTEIKKVLGYKGRDEAIHRNDMVIK